MNTEPKTPTEDEEPDDDHNTENGKPEDDNGDGGDE